MIKTVNLLRFLSIILFLIAFSFIYAYMPVMVRLNPGSTLEIHKENFFYYGAGLFLIINIISRIISIFFTPRIVISRGEEAAAWFSALPFVINLYMVFIIGFLGALNNSSHILAESYSYLNFLGPAIFFLWICGLIYFIVLKK